MKRIAFFISSIVLSSSFFGALAEDNTALDLYNKGRQEYLTFSNKGYVSSIYYYNKAIELDKNFALAYAGLSESKLALSMNANTKINKINTSEIELDAFEKAFISVKLNTNISESHRALSHVYYFQFRYKEALEEAKKAVEINPNDAESYLLYWLNNVGNNTFKFYKEPIKYYKLLNTEDPVIQKAISLNPNLASIYVELGVASYFQSEYFKAIEYFEKVKKLSPDNDDSYTFLGAINLEMNKYDEAQKNYMKAIKLDENNPFANNGLGMLYIKSRDNDKANKYLKKACELGDTDSCDMIKDKNNANFNETKDDIEY
ncbi:MAG: tetratricopeptide repeat protein [Candidatus Sericytochromatia bacterium]